MNFLSFLRLRTVWKTFRKSSCSWTWFIKCHKAMKVPVRPTPLEPWTTVQSGSIFFRLWTMSKSVKVFFGAVPSDQLRWWSIVNVWTSFVLQSNIQIEFEKCYFFIKHDKHLQAEPRSINCVTYLTLTKPYVKFHCHLYLCHGTNARPIHFIITMQCLRKVTFFKSKVFCT